MKIKLMHSLDIDDSTLGGFYASRNLNIRCNYLIYLKRENMFVLNSCKIGTHIDLKKL